MVNAKEVILRSYCDNAVLLLPGLSSEQPLHCAIFRSPSPALSPASLCHSQSDIVRPAAIHNHSNRVLSWIQKAAKGEYQLVWVNVSAHVVSNAVNNQ